jgi:bacterioferritin-associated ferredoxin
MYVCLCNGVTDRAIRQTAEAGCRSMTELTMRTGCGAGCGSCICAATEILDEVSRSSMCAAGIKGDTGIAHAA